MRCFASWIVGASEPMRLSCHIYECPFSTIVVFFLFCQSSTIFLPIGCKSIFMCKDMSYTYISYMSVSQHVHERTSDLALAPSLTKYHHNELAIAFQFLEVICPKSLFASRKNMHGCSRNYSDMLIYSRINYFC